EGDHREDRDRPRAVPPVHEDQENEDRLESGDRQDRGSAEVAEGAPADPDEQFDDEAEHEDAVDRDVLRFIEHRYHLTTDTAAGRGRSRPRRPSPSRSRTPRPLRSPASSSAP